MLVASFQGKGDCLRCMEILVAEGGYSSNANEYLLWSHLLFLLQEGREGTLLGMNDRITKHRFCTLSGRRAHSSRAFLSTNSWQQNNNFNHKLFEDYSDT